MKTFVATFVTPRNRVIVYTIRAKTWTAAYQAAVAKQIFTNYDCLDMSLVSVVEKT